MRIVLQHASQPLGLQQMLPFLPRPQEGSDSGEGSAVVPQQSNPFLMQAPPPKRARF